ncbi:MAG: translational GTPase TypA [Fimbriimonas ginsengisoli]|uniref:50S ribosomal subunit assembly factor BipA n=1 Tax=Fimbriimonas ginsengisoli TaxID=1005039 RepID=A0A931LWD1_FIMGI|nr:translational GTPase TypA [Fimbriimonas ginsengisoli]
MPLSIRNVGIIAHVDHGKTTLVDAIFRQAGLFRDNQHVQERIMDSNELEREKGITILSKVASVRYRGTKINIVDTPGHVDFGGEVERVLSMVDGVLLIVDAFEGPMPQTRFVLKKAFENHLKPIVCINKIDREGARPLEAYDKTLDLFIDLGASADDLFFPHLYTSGTAGFARVSPDGAERDLRELFETIVNAVPPPTGDPEAPLLLQVNNLDYSDYLGRMFGGKVLQGEIKVGDRLLQLREDRQVSFTVSNLWTYEGLSLAEAKSVRAGEIAMLSGLEDVRISDTLASPANPVALPPIQVEPSTLTMDFYANNSPLAGRDGGKFLTIHKIRERLEKEEAVSVSVTIDRDAPPEIVKVAARGELQLAVLIETMRREGYEMQISRPQVILRREAGELQEPFETLTLELPSESVGDVMEELSRRRGELREMETLESGAVRLQYSMPTRGLIGFRSGYLGLTRGLGLMSTLFDGYQPYRGEVVSRTQGSLIAKDPGRLTRYAYEDIQERGSLFYEVGTELYGGMIVGACARDEDMIVNATKAKAANNIRSSTSESTIPLDPNKEFSLEQALAWLRDDELLEATPKQLRFRKKVLDHAQRRVAERRSAVTV